MLYRPLGQTGLTVSMLGMGTWPLGGGVSIDNQAYGYGDLGEQDAEAAVAAARVGGVTLFDTADFYGLGRSEEVLGRALAGDKNAIIVTKAGYDTDGRAPPKQQFDKTYLVSALEQSLSRLQRDVVDIFMLHTIPDTPEKWDQAKAALLEITRQGLAHHTGVSVAHRMDVGCELVEDDTVAVIEMYFNPLNASFQDALSTKCRDLGIGVLAASPFCRGLLTPDFDPHRVYCDNDVRRGWANNRDKFDADLVERSDVAKRAADAGLDIAAFSLSQIWNDQTVSSVIPGMRNERHVADNLARAAAFEAEVMGAIDS